MNASKLLLALALAVPVATPGCFFGSDDDDDGPVTGPDTCIVTCDDDHTECTTACTDDACILDCDTVRDECKADCD
jgi:hypothetical protein